MAATKKMMVLIGMLLSLVLAAYADDGTATYNTIYNPSACDGYSTPTSMVAAACDNIWNGGGACGRQYTVTCTGGTNQGTPHPCTGQSVTVQIVDYCRNCRGTFDLSEDAFGAIADMNAGKILIQYDQV